MKRIDLTGKPFGRLEVIELLESRNGRLVWTCRCACGDECAVAGNNLTSGNTTSCGCYRYEQIVAATQSKRRGVFTDLTNLVVGRWTVKSFAGTINGKPFWNCLCVCGTFKPVMAQSLRKGTTTSCGCFHREQVSRLIDLDGQTFGRLKVRCRDGTIVICDCSCGTEVRTRAASLINGHTTSCGCFHREQIGEISRTHGLSQTPEYRALKSRERLEREYELDTEWTLEMELALRKFQPACVVCSSLDNLSVDHVKPLSKGYGLRPGNAVILCVPCNTRKLDRDLIDLPTQTARAIRFAAATFSLHWRLNNREP